MTSSFDRVSEQPQSAHCLFRENRVISTNASSFDTEMPQGHYSRLPLVHSMLNYVRDPAHTCTGLLPRHACFVSPFSAADLSFFFSFYTLRTSSLIRTTVITFRQQTISKNDSRASFLRLSNPLRTRSRDPRTTLRITGSFALRNGALAFSCAAVL